MNESDKKIITELINRNGIKEIEWLIETNKYLLNYMSESKGNKSYYENSKEQIFTNGYTSVFYLSQKIFDFNLFKTFIDNPLNLVDKDEINKYFEKSRKLFGDWQRKIYLKDDRGFVFYRDEDEDLITFRLNEYRLLKLLLKNPKIYTSLKNPLIYAESEYGHAYILGNKKRQLTY